MDFTRVSRDVKSLFRTRPTLHIPQKLNVA